MKILSATLTVTLLTVAALRAQVVADGTNTLSNVTTNFTGELSWARTARSPC